MVLAGTNGAGKSSIGGAALRAAGAEYFNPDEATRRIMTANPGVSLEDANGAAWQEGRRLLESAIDTRRDFAFETTLGGNTITTLLERACTAGIGLAALRVYDNSREADPSAGIAPEPRLLLHMVDGRVQTTCDLGDAPEWVKPILAVALSVNRD